MRIWKRNFLAVLLVIISMAFCGCGVLGYSFVENVDGSFDENYSISLVVPEEDPKSATDIELLKADIKADYDKMTEELKNQFYAKLSFGGYDESNRTRITFSGKWNESIFVGNIHYDSYEIYAFFYDIGEAEPTPWKETKGVFYNTFSTVQKSVFANAVPGNELYDKYMSKYADFIKLDSTMYLYQYVTTNSRLHSNSDITIQEGRERYNHIWIMSTDQAERDIEFFYNKANPWIWYVMALGVTLTLGTIIWVASVVKDKKADAKQKKVDNDFNKLY